MGPTVDMAASATEAQWYYTREELALPPSVRAGMSLVEERNRRQSAVKGLWKIRDSSSFKQPVITAAATFVHRFYMRETFQEWDYKLIAAAALFLASKSEEEPRSIKSLVGWMINPAGDDPNAATSPLAMDTRQKIIVYEEAMLRVLCFDLTVRHPHWIAVSATKAMWSDEEAEVRDKVAQAAWMILNDSLPAPLCLLHTPPVLAAAALVLACVQLDVSLPGPPPPVSEQRAAHELAVQEAEEGEETQPFEPRVFWLDVLGIKAEALREPVQDMVDVYKLANDPFVVEEGARLAAKAAAALVQFAAASNAPSPVPPRPGTTTPVVSDLEPAGNGIDLS
ncbi:hypothetical protein JCM3770_000396 [Rhodotorula araucariae]